jgi:multidrug/hemolysin transport system ATP-binding protein
MEKILEINNLCKTFGEYKAVKNLNFTVECGSFFAFLGQNGAGKSTTINIILGLLKADTGNINYDNSLTSGGSANFKNEIGVVFQNNVLDDLLTIEENLLLYGQIYLNNRAEVKQRYNEIIELLSIDYTKKQFGVLSGGQKRKAEIARALFNRPRLLFLDEPTTGLDSKTRKEVWEVLDKIRKNVNMTVFLTTHYLEETTDAKKIVIINKGEKICEGSPSELKSKYSFDTIRITPKNAESFEKQLVERNLEYKKVADLYNIIAKNVSASIELLYNLKENILFFEVIKGTMDDVFLNAVGMNLGGENNE